MRRSCPSGKRESKERFPNDHLVSVVQFDWSARLKAAASIDKSPVQTPNILNRDLVTDANQGMLSRDTSFGIIHFQINFREGARIGIPPADQVVSLLQGKLFSQRAA